MNIHFNELHNAARHLEGLAVANRALALYPQSEVPHAHSWAAASKWQLGNRLGAIDSSRKGMPYGIPLDLWTGLEYDWDFFDDLDPLRRVVGLVYVEEYDQIRQILIDTYNDVEPVSDEGNANGYYRFLDYLLSRGTLETLAGDLETAVEFFEQARLQTQDEEGGLVRANIFYSVLDWSRQSHFSLAVLFAYRKSGRHEQADIFAVQFEELLAEEIDLIAMVTDLADHRFLYREVQYYAIEGRTVEALDKLRIWADDGVNIFTYIKWDPFLESLRGDPEFEVIVAEVEAELAEIRVQYHAQQAKLDRT